MNLMEITKIDWKKSIVRSNDYSSATYSLSPDAHRIISVAISAIAQNDLSFTTYRIYAKDLVNFFPALHSDKNAIARIDKATDSLMWAYIKIKQKNGWLKRNLLHSCQFNKNEGHPYVDIKLGNDMMPYLLNVNGYFSAPKLENIRLFKKDQHFKLHAYFYSFLYRQSTGMVTIENLRNILDIDKKQYKLVGHLKSRLLIPSVKVINDVTDINISIKEVKHGRKIAGFIFNISNKNPGGNNNKISNKPNNAAPEDSLSQEYLKLGVPEIDYKTLSKKHGGTYLEQLLIYVKYKQWQIKIVSLKNYLFGILKKKPALDELLTPNCIIKEQNKKRQLQASKNTEEVNTQQQNEIEQSQKVNIQVENYLLQQTSDDLWLIKKEFNNSLFAGWLKFGQESVDFEKPIVKATFYHFVHIKYLSTKSKG